MKILFVIAYAWEYGGGEVYASHVVQALRRCGHDVRVFASDNHRERISFGDYLFREFRYEPCASLSGILNVRSLLAFGKVMREFRPDIVHIQTLDFQMTASVLLGLGKTPAVMTLHAYTVFNAFHENRTALEYASLSVKKAVTLQLLRTHVSRFLCPCAFMAGMAKQYGLPGVSVVPYGIPLLRYAPLPRQNTVLYLGRLFEDKGIEYLLRAIPLAAGSVPDMALYIVGEGYDQTRLQSLTRQLNIADKVNFLGKVKNAMAQDYYRYSKIVVIPSIRAENFPLVALEAMSMGRPIIGTCDGGLPDLIDDGRTGFIVERRNPRQIADKLVYLLKHPNIAGRMGQKAAEKSERYNLPDHIRTLCGIYRSLLPE